jgi:hypothetical protein
VDIKLTLIGLQLPAVIIILADEAVFFVFDQTLTRKRLLQWGIILGPQA